MLIKVKTTSEGKKALASVEGIAKKTPNAIRQCLYRVGKVFQKTANKGILKSRKTGNTYSYKGRKYRASKPGQYPANVSGANRRSIGFNVKGKKTLYFGAGEKHSEFLVKGTKNMRPRDFLLKAMKQSKQEANRILTVELNKRITK